MSLLATHHIAQYELGTPVFLLKIYLFCFNMYGCLWPGLYPVPLEAGRWHHITRNWSYRWLRMTVDAERSLGSLWQYPVHLADSLSLLPISQVLMPPQSPTVSLFLLCLFSSLQFIKKRSIFRELRASLGVKGSLVCIWVNAAGSLSIRFGVSGHLYSVSSERWGSRTCMVTWCCLLFL